MSLAGKISAVAPMLVGVLGGGCILVLIPVVAEFGLSEMASYLVATGAAAVVGPWGGIAVLGRGKSSADAGGEVENETGPGDDTR